MSSLGNWIEGKLPAQKLTSPLSTLSSLPIPTPATGSNLGREEQNSLHISYGQGSTVASTAEMKSKWHDMPPRERFHRADTAAAKAPEAEKANCVRGYA